jgi:hypothetical protein
LPKAFHDESHPAFSVGRMLHRVKKTRQNKEMGQEKSSRSPPATSIPSI